jgi:hypothetical protein
MCEMFILPWRNPKLYTASGTWFRCHGPLYDPNLPFQIVLTPGVIEKGIAHMDKMQENDLALTFQDQQYNVNALC